ncbi:MAG TPA: dienelactone hydrolase family protein [Gammaproteobacteria bacterium]|nr:dienelactone hydrolase family protein [Gammaproteobacteria bacterium]
MHRQNNVEIAPGFEGYVERPKGNGPFPGVLVIMEAFGVTGHIHNVCKRLADAGFVALAPDHFHGEVIPYDSQMDKILDKLKSLKDEQLVKEVSQSLDWFDMQAGVRRDAHGIIGFCMGGRLAFLANCRFPIRFQASVSFYGGAIAPGVDPDRFGRTPPIGEAAKMQAPMFLGYGADDQGIPGDEHARIAKTLTDLKKRYVLSVYPGAGHAFLCEERPAYAPAVEPIAWREAIEFLHANLG